VHKIIKGHFRIQEILDAGFASGIVLPPLSAARTLNAFFSNDRARKLLILRYWVWAVPGRFLRESA
jgi:hypothetical protein